MDKRQLTQIGRALDRLGIEHIPAYSPQAHGRSERLNRTPHSGLGYLTPAEFKAKHLAGSIDGGRSPVMPARADIRKNEEPLTGLLGTVLQ